MRTTTSNTPYTHLARWRRPLAASLLALVGIAMALPTAAMSIRQLRALEKSDKKQGSIYADYYLVGVMEGALEAHNQAVRNGAAPSICLNGRRLEPRMARSLYTTERQRNADLYEADMPVELVMRNALETVYAC
jgi:hypothetical protein